MHGAHQDGHAPEQHGGKPDGVLVARNDLGLAGFEGCQAGLGVCLQALQLGGILVAEAFGVDGQFFKHGGIFIPQRGFRAA